MLRQSVPNLAGKHPRNIDPGLHPDIDQALGRAQLLMVLTALRSGEHGLLGWSPSSEQWGAHCCPGSSNFWGKLPLFSLLWIKGRQPTPPSRPNTAPHSHLSARQ